MTNKEAIKWLNKNRPCISMHCNKENADNINIATDMAIKALKYNIKIKDLSERVKNIERQMEEDKEEQLKKLKAELDYAKFCCTL